MEYAGEACARTALAGFYDASTYATISYLRALAPTWPHKRAPSKLSRQ